MTEKIEKILIIGGGELGQAMKKVLSVTGDSIVFDIDQTKSETDKNLSELVGEASLIFLALPGRALVDIGEDLKLNITKETIVISLSKGLSADGQTSAEILAEYVSDKNLALMSGPMIAEEILAGKIGFATIASKEDAVRGRLAKIFSHDLLDVTVSEDVVGVAVAGVCKNIYTIGLSIADGLKLGYNTQGILLAQAVKEIGKMIYLLGGDTSSALFMAGLSDLVTTAASPDSQNKKVGQDIAISGMTDKESEGLYSLPLLVNRLGPAQVENLPFLSVINQVVLKKEDAKDVFSQYIQSIN